MRNISILLSLTISATLSISALAGTAENVDYSIGMDVSIPIAGEPIAMKMKDPLTDGTIAFGCIKAQTLNKNSNQVVIAGGEAITDTTRYKRIESNNMGGLSQSYMDNGTVFGLSSRINGKASDTYVSGCSH